jgi:hypothetical protein
VEEMVLAYLKAIHPHSVGVAEENHEKPQFLSNVISLSELTRSYFINLLFKVGY